MFNELILSLKNIIIGLSILISGFLNEEIKKEEVLLGAEIYTKKETKIIDEIKNRKQGDLMIRNPEDVAIWISLLNKECAKKEWNDFNSKNAIDTFNNQLSIGC